MSFRIPFLSFYSALIVRRRFEYSSSHDATPYLCNKKIVPFSYTTSSSISFRKIFTAPSLVRRRFNLPSQIFLLLFPCASIIFLRANSPPETVMFSMIPTTTLPIIPFPNSLFFSTRPLLYCHWHQPMCKKTQKHSFIPMCGIYQVGGTSQSTQQEQRGDDENTSHYEALLKGGEQVTSVLQEMVNLVCPLFFSLPFCCLLPLR